MNYITAYAGSHEEQFNVELAEYAIAYAFNYNYLQKCLNLGIPLELRNI